MGNQKELRRRGMTKCKQWNVVCEGQLDAQGNIDLQTKLTKLTKLTRHEMQPAVLQLQLARARDQVRSISVFHCIWTFMTMKLTPEGDDDVPREVLSSPSSSNALPKICTDYGQQSGVSRYTHVIVL